MRTRYKILIIVLVAVVAYWPAIPLVVLACHSSEIDKDVCFDIARLRIPNPFLEEGWDYYGKSSK